MPGFVVGTSGPRSQTNLFLFLNESCLCLCLLFAFVVVCACFCVCILSLSCVLGSCLLHRQSWLSNNEHLEMYLNPYPYPYPYPYPHICSGSAEGSILTRCMPYEANTRPKSKIRPSLHYSQCYYTIHALLLLWGWVGVRVGVGVMVT